MKKAFLTAIAVAALALGGCATQSTITSNFDKDGKVVQTTEKLSDYAFYAKSQEPAKDRPVLFDMQCGAQPCSFASLKVYDPQSGGSSGSKLAPPPEDFATTVVKEAFATLRGAVPYGAAASVLNTALKHANGAVTTSTRTSSSSTDSHNSSTQSSTSVTASGTGSSAASGGNATGSSTSTETTSTNSGNRTANGGGTTTGDGGGATTGP